MTTTNIINSTISHVERCYSDAKLMESTSGKRTFFDHAFGAIQLASVLLPCDELDAINTLWEEYRPKFETLIYGV